MGRGKIEIKEIENVKSRQVTFSKRTSGIKKKAIEISALCDAKVSLVIFNSANKMMHHWCSENTKLENILEAYHQKDRTGERLWDAKHQDLYDQIERIKKENENIQLNLRHLKGEELQSLDVEELLHLQNAVDEGLTNIRNQTMENHETWKRSLKRLEGENEHLKYALALQQKELANGYHHQQQQQTVRDCNLQAPFCYRVQPMQPNLQGDHMY